MCVGGVVVGLEKKDDRPGDVRVTVAEPIRRRGRPPRLDVANATAVWVEERPIRLGDQLWWQGAFAMWTPQEAHADVMPDRRGGVDYDIQIPRKGYSHEGEVNEGFVAEWTE